MLTIDVILGIFERVNESDAGHGGSARFPEDPTFTTSKPWGLLRASAETAAGRFSYVREREAQERSCVIKVRGLTPSWGKSTASLNSFVARFLLFNPCPGEVNLRIL